MDRPNNKTVRYGETLKIKSDVLNLSSENFFKWGTPLHADLYEAAPIKDDLLNLSSLKFKPNLTLNVQPSICNDLLDKYSGWFLSNVDKNPFEPILVPKFNESSEQIVFGGLRPLKSVSFRSAGTSSVLWRFNLPNSRLHIIRENWNVGWRDNAGHRNYSVELPLSETLFVERNQYDSRFFTSSGVPAELPNVNRLINVYEGEGKLYVLRARQNYLARGSFRSGNGYTGQNFRNKANRFEKNKSASLVLEQYTSDGSFEGLRRPICEIKISPSILEVINPKAEKAFQIIEDTLWAIIGFDHRDGQYLCNTGTLASELWMANSTYEQMMLLLTRPHIAFKEAKKEYSTNPYETPKSYELGDAVLGMRKEYLQKWSEQDAWTYQQFNNLNEAKILLAESLEPLLIKNSANKRLKEEIDNWIFNGAYGWLRLMPVEHYMPTERSIAETIGLTVHDAVELEAGLKSGWNPNTQNNFGKTPLMYAAQLGKLEALEILLKYGASPNIKTFGTEKSPGCNYEWDDEDYPITRSAFDYAKQAPNKNEVLALLNNPPKLLPNTEAAKIMERLRKLDDERICEKSTQSVPGVVDFVMERDRRGLPCDQILQGFKDPVLGMENFDDETICDKAIDGDPEVADFVLEREIRGLDCVDLLK